MDQVFIDALVNQALGAYNLGGDEGLRRWKEALPAPHRAEFEKHCSDLLLKAIAGLDLSRGPEQAEDETDNEKTQPSDPRQKHTRDRRRTKPL